MSDTVFALASARGRAGISVIRVSGPSTPEVARLLCGDVPPVRRASLRRLRGTDGDVLDDAIVLSFAEGRSFTGEPVVEFHVHGSPAIVKAVMATLAQMPGLRHADAGEFTRRALLNGRMDLTQVEGLADLIEAETEAQLQQARRVFDGELGQKTASWRARLLQAMASVEVTIDFGDEDVPEDVSPEVGEILSGLVVEWSAELEGAAAAERVRDGFEVAVLGPPNAGKSTLVNAIAKRDVAITSEVAGTTRDVIEVRLDLRGIPVTLLDTAGLRNSADRVEAIGVSRTRDRAARSDLRVFVSPSAVDLGTLKQAEDIVVHGKCDLGVGPGLNVSGATGDGVRELLDRIADILAARVPRSTSAMNMRHSSALTTAVSATQAARDMLAADTPVDLVAAELRHAVHALDVLVGRVDVEDVLGHIFANFCIGK